MVCLLKFLYVLLCVSFFVRHVNLIGSKLGIVSTHSNGLAIDTATLDTTAAYNPLSNAMDSSDEETYNYRSNHDDSDIVGMELGRLRPNKVQSLGRKYFSG